MRSCDGGWGMGVPLRLGGIFICGRRYEWLKAQGIGDAGLGHSMFRCIFCVLKRQRCFAAKTHLLLLL